MSTNKTAERLADLTFTLLKRCQEKETWLAKEHGLFQAEFKCLRLFGFDESLNNTQISKRMKLSPSRLTRIIDGLEKKGYMQREIAQKDRRNMRIFLSRRGKILTNKLNDWQVKYKTCFAGIDAGKIIFYQFEISIG